MEEKIIEILLDELSYAYCDNCGTESENDCEFCHRKYQNWSLGKNTAKTLAKKIIAAVQSNDALDQTEKD